MSQDPFQEYPRSAAQVLRSRHPAFRAASQWPWCVAPLCPIRPRHFVAGPTPNETNETTCRYKKCVFSYNECLMCTLSRYDFCPHRDTKWYQSGTPRPTDIFGLPLHPLPATLESAQLYAPALRLEEETCDCPTGGPWEPCFAKTNDETERLLK